jgi:hypothetical protein
MPTESLSSLTISLKAAQSRAATLSTNFARLMRLFLADELESVDREIAQVKNGSNDELKSKYKEALVECESKQRIAKARLIAAENEIDIRFGAMVETDWSTFNVPPFLFGVDEER